MVALRAQIEEVWRQRGEVSFHDTDAGAVVHEGIELLDRAEARVAEVVDDEVVVHEWPKQAILLVFRQARIVTAELGPFELADEIPLKSGYEAGVCGLDGGQCRAQTSCSTRRSQ